MKCGESNKSEESRCSKCGRTLLPGKAVGSRIKDLGWILVLFIVIYGVFLLAADKFSPLLLLLVMGVPLLIPLWGLWSLITPTDLAQKYAMRAERHVEIDLQQALTDYSEAIRLSNDRKTLPGERNLENPYYHYDRGEVYEKMGRLKEAHADFQVAVKIGSRSEAFRSKFKTALDRTTQKLEKKAPERKS